MEESRFDPARLIELVAKGAIPLDGSMSPQTQRLLKQFNATSVDMTIWWAKTPQSWVCPACGRTKAEIARLNKNGALMCRLSRHHDHMANVLDEKFREHVVSMEKIVADALAKEFAERASPMMSSYDHTIICDDCNKADPDAKELIGAPRDFSFSPSEIRSFIKITRNGPHIIDPEKARTVWEACAPNYDLRMKIINRIACIAAHNEHWFQRSPPEAIPSRIKHDAEVIARHHNYIGSLDVLCGRTLPVSQDVSSWRNKRQPPPSSLPTERDIEFLIQVDQLNWTKVPDHWACPGCGRAKTHIVRKKSKEANKDKWIFPIQRLTFHVEDDDKRLGNMHVCADCADTAKLLGKEAVVVAGTKHDTYANQVSINELREIVLPQNNGRHNYRQDAIEGVLRRISLRLKVDEDEENEWLVDD